MFFMAIGLYNCKPTASEPEVPTFEEEYKDVKLPEVKPTAPEAVVSTPATITASAAIASLSADLASGKVTPAVTAAAANVQKVVSEAEVNKISAALTPALLTSLSNGGALPADLKATMLAIAGNPALAAYLPTFTLPTVDGKVISGFVKETPAKNNEDIITHPDFSVAEINSPCTDGARAAYNTARASLDATKATQELLITTAYNSAVSAANASTEPGKAALVAKYTPLRNTALQALNAGLASLEANKAGIGAMYDLLKILYLSAYADALDIFDKLQKAENSAVESTTTATIAKALTARNKDLVTIQTNYNAALAGMEVKLNASFKTCHDQGQGD